MRLGPLHRWGVFVAALAAALMTAPVLAQGELDDALVELGPLMESGRWEEAEAQLRELARHGGDPRSGDLLGVVLNRQGRHEEAEAQFRAVLAEYPGYRPAREHLARVYLSSNRSREAIEELRRLAESGGLPRDLGFAAAEIERKAENWAAALQILQSLVEEFDSVRALVETARIHSQTGNTAASLTTLERALRQAPNSEDILSTYARLSYASGAPVPAIWTFEHLVRMQPTVVDYPYLLGIARMQVNDITGAVEALERALALQPNRPLSLVALGIAFNEQKRFADAKQVLTAEAVTAMGGAEVEAALAETEEGLGNLDQAELHARAALGQVPNLPRANLVLGKVLMARGNLPAAQAALAAAVDAAPGSAKAHYQLSQAYARSGDAQRAEHHIRLYRQALRTAQERLEQLLAKRGFTAGGMGS